MGSARINLDESTHCPCCDCGVETNHNHTDQAEWYMVEHPVWEQATASKPAIYLCIGCLEGRLGRRLKSIDFSVAPVNYMPWAFLPSRRLLDRILDGKLDDLLKDISQTTDSAYIKKLKGEMT